LFFITAHSKMHYVPYTSKTHFYRVAPEKPARRLVDQRGRRSQTLYRKLTF